MGSFDGKTFPKVPKATIEGAWIYLMDNFSPREQEYCTGHHQVFKGPKDGTKEKHYIKLRFGRAIVIDDKVYHCQPSRETTLEYTLQITQQTE